MTPDKPSRAGSGASATLADLVVLDRLEVGPPRIERHRVVASYTVHRGRRKSHFDLVYKFGEDVFDPEDSSGATANLASMMVSQVALNYGLFCREIVLRGTFDKRDRRFLEEMLDNTSREILVKKFLEPNPFLIGKFQKLQVEKQRRYTQARLVVESAAETLRAGPWPTRPEGAAVLSSGGKDSLLSYGLLREMGADPHPIFVNESGRHWFTALNAFRQFQKDVPTTARVWTNSDRVFAFMLRQLPFVRKDFQSVRSDDYPIRLWTVAVFLFGALPLLRKRGLGRLVIGDEFDTTVRAHHGGIPHYDGLYDQSRWFDAALSRYFVGKGWDVHQFSLLRPLSELLIEKVLVERYPDLLSLQTSCHATHPRGDRVLPCGRCEKCRRIVAMITALGGDPTKLGYEGDALTTILAQVEKHGVHQERPAVELLGSMLQRRGLLPSGHVGKIEARDNDEALQLRLQKDRAELSDIPLDLRRGLIAIFLEHAAGAVRRVERQWIKTDLWSDPELGEASEGSDGFLWGELTWPSAQARLREVDMALLPVGAVEQHGPHLPLDIDAYDAEFLCHEVARGCSKPRPLVLPLLPYGVSYHHEDFAGTVSVRNETLTRLVYDIGTEVARNGIKKLVIVNGHGGNGPALHQAAQMINRDAHIFTCVESGETSDAEIEALCETPNDVHAGEIETSTALASRPHLVHMEVAEPYVPRFQSEYLDFGSGRSVEWYARTMKLSPNGVLGDPSKATAEKGREMWRIMIQRLVELVDHLKPLSLSEIHERRY